MTSETSAILLPVDPHLEESLRPYTISNMVIEEYYRATKKFSPFNSVHEGYAIILEELDELWEEIKKKKDKRRTKKMLEEAIHVAAMAMRFANDMCGDAI